MNAVAPHQHRRSALLVGGISAGMFAFGFALAPFYGEICAALGIQTANTRVSTLNSPAATPTVRPVTIRFDTTVNGNLPWTFDAIDRRMEIDTGSLYTATFRVRNLSDRPLIGRAVPSVTPWQATPYLDKLECFCFQEQPLAPGAEAELSLRFAVLPDLPERFGALTLSYTFMNIDPDAVALPMQTTDAGTDDHHQSDGTAHEPEQRHAG